MVNNEGRAMIYAVCGFVGGAGLFAPSAVLAYLMLGCWSRSAGCEITGPAVLGMLVAATAFLVPLAGGLVSAIRGEPDAMLTALAGAFVLVAAEWTIVLGEIG